MSDWEDLCRAIILCDHDAIEVEVAKGCDLTAALAEFDMMPRCLEAILVHTTCAHLPFLKKMDEENALYMQRFDLTQHPEAAAVMNKSVRLIQSRIAYLIIQGVLKR